MTDQKCGTKTCTEPATHRVHWPGQTLDMCEACADRASGLAHVMGFSLTIELLLLKPALPPCEGLNCKDQLALFEIVRQGGKIERLCSSCCVRAQRFSETAGDIVSIGTINPIPLPPTPEQLKL